MKPTLTGFLIAMVCISFAAAFIGLFISNLAGNYGVDDTGINLSNYDNLNELYSQADDIKESTLKIDQPTGVLDTIGGFFYNSYKVLVTIPQSFELFIDMTEQATLDSNLGSTGVLMKRTLITVILILIIIGVILAILLKTDRL